MLWMDEVTKWMAIHPVRVDVAVLVLVAGTIFFLRHQRRLRRVAHRKVWAMVLKRKDLERLHLMRFEDAITDAAYEMVARGEMTEAMEEFWYKFFADKYGFKGLLPQLKRPSKAAIKRGIRTRLAFWLDKKPNIPGGLAEVKADENYNPKEGKSLKSKYVD